MSERPALTAEELAAQLRKLPDPAGHFARLTAGLDPLARAQLAVDVAEWSLDGPASLLEVLDPALEVLGQHGQLGSFLRGLVAAARIGLSTAPGGDAGGPEPLQADPLQADPTPYIEALSDVAEAQGLWSWASLARVLGAELDLARGRIAQARAALLVLNDELARGGDPELRRHVSALLRTLPEGQPAAVALGHLRARRYAAALELVRAGEPGTAQGGADMAEARAVVLGELAPLAEALPAIGQLGALARQRGDLRLELSAHLLAAERLCAEGLDPSRHGQAAAELAERVGNAGAAARALATQARWTAAQGDYASAQTALAQAASLADGSDLDALVAVGLATYAVTGQLAPLREAEELSRNDGSGVLRAGILNALALEGVALHSEPEGPEQDGIS